MGAVANNQLVERIRELSAEAVESTGIEIADVQLKGAGSARLLRVYIDKPAGVSHADCELVSSRMSDILDRSDVMPEESYTLEVSSLGPDRKLLTARDFERVIGQKIAVVMRTAPNEKSTLEGELTAVDGDHLELTERGGGTLRVRIDQVQKAKLRFVP